MATRNAKKAHAAPYRQRSATQTHKDEWVFNEQEAMSLGQEMAERASSQVKDAGNYWSRCRDIYIAAQDHGRAEQALAALFTPGDNIQGRKAPWYRTYKSILTSALSLKIRVEGEFGVTALQRLIKEAKDAAVESDPKAKQLKDEQMIVMFTRLAQGCINRGIEKQTLVNALRGLS